MSAWSAKLAVNGTIVTEMGSRRGQAQEGDSTPRTSSALRSISQRPLDLEIPTEALRRSSLCRLRDRRLLKAHQERHFDVRISRDAIHLYVLNMAERCRLASACVLPFKLFRGRNAAAADFSSTCIHKIPPTPPR